VGAGGHEVLPRVHAGPGHVGELRGKGGGAAQDDDVGEVAAAADRRRQLEELLAEDEQPGAAVGGERADVVRLEHRADRHGDGADPQAGEERGEQLRGVAHAQQQALLGPDTGADQGGGEPVDGVVKLGVAERADAAVQVEGGDRPLVRRRAGVPGDQPLGGVERLAGDRRRGRWGLDGGHDQNRT
jgi:hypothetical protein